MKSPLHLAGKEIAELRRAFEEGRLAAASGLSIDANPFRAAGKQSAWANGWHQGQRDKAVPPPGSTVERVSHPILDALRLQLADRDSFKPGWWIQRHDTAHHFSAESESACAVRRFDFAWKPAADESKRCKNCIEWLDLRERSRTSAPISPERRAALAREFEALMGRNA